eukprot:gene15664-18896_t
MSKNGEAYILGDRAKALANYPHMRKAAGLLFVSGISSRRPDNSYAGVSVDADENVIDLTVFLVNMEHYNDFNSVYNNYFNAENGPTRTTVAVHQLPNPNLLIEIKATALAP